MTLVAKTSKNIAGCDVLTGEEIRIRAHVAQHRPRSWRALAGLAVSAGAIGTIAANVYCAARRCAVAIESAVPDAGPAAADQLHGPAKLCRLAAQESGVKPTSGILESCTAVCDTQTSRDKWDSHCHFARWDAHAREQHKRAQLGIT